ncbi:MAG: CopD family protein [Alkalilacustris sp.]
MEWLFGAYPWIRAFHIMAVIAWMAGLFYLPRLYVYHVEQVGQTGDTHALFQTMEEKLLRIIMNPAMIAAWVLGLLLVAIPGIVQWDMVWPWTKLAGLVGMTWFHMWLAARRKDFIAGVNRLSGRQYRMMNEVPTLLMVVIVLSVVVKF